MSTSLIGVAPSQAAIRDFQVAPKATTVQSTVWGGTSPKGFDCSGFVQYVFRASGISLPRTAAEQYKLGTPVSRDKLKPGDLVFFQTYAPGALM